MDNHHSCTGLKLYLQHRLLLRFDWTQKAVKLLLRWLSIQFIVRYAWRTEKWTDGRTNGQRRKQRKSRRVLRWYILVGLGWIRITYGSKIERLRICQLWKFEWKRRRRFYKKKPTKSILFKNKNKKMIILILRKKKKKKKKTTADIWLKKYLVIQDILVIRIPQTC